MDCTPAICPDIPLHTVVFGSREKWRLHFSMRSTSAHRSTCSGARREEAVRGTKEYKAARHGSVRTVKRHFIRAARGCVPGPNARIVEGSPAHVFENFSPILPGKAQAPKNVTNFVLP